MPAPFRFLDRIDALVGGPASVATTVRELVRPGGDRPVTRASDASRIPAADVLAHVREVALGVVQERVRDGLVDALRDHLGEVRAEHEMIEGPCPHEGTGSFRRDQWGLTFMFAVSRSFENGDLAVFGKPLHTSFDGSAESLADAVIAAPVNNPDAVLARVGLTAAVLDGIVAEIRKLPLQTELPQTLREDIIAMSSWSLERLASSWAFTGETADAELFREAVTYVLGDIEMIDTGAELLGLAADEAFLAWARERAAFSDPAQDEADVAEVLRLAKGGGATDNNKTRPETAADGDEEKPPAAQNLSIARKVVSKTGEVLEDNKRVHSSAFSTTDESPLTRAVGAALAVLYDHGCETDKAMAEALGVQKAVVNQSRHGKTPWVPDDAQREMLVSMVGKHLNALVAARNGLLTVSNA